MLVAVGSLNPVKVEAARSVFEAAFGGGVDVSAVAPPQLKGQPMSLEEVLEGSRLRSRASCGAARGADYCVGIESGLEMIGGGWYVLTAATVADRSGVESTGLGPAFALPPKVSELILGGLEMEAAMERLYGVKDLGESIGAVGLLSRGLSSRLELCAEAVKMALIPLISRGEYGLGP